MKSTIVFLLVLISTCTYGQTQTPRSMSVPPEDQEALTKLIASYAQARETRDTLLLREILVEDIDQLVSSGVWRRGIHTAIAGMGRSSARNPGKRTLTVDHIRLITAESGIVDARYEIRNADGSVRKMWSTFITVKVGKEWKIAAIRNMLPAQ